MCHKLDPIFFKKLLEKDTAEVCRRSLAEYYSDTGFYRIVALGNEYFVCPEANDIKPVNKISDY